MSIKIYVEGGGKGKLRQECRRGFRHFLEKAGLHGKMPKIMACGSREDAFRRFKTAQDNNEPALLLVDSEGPVPRGISPWQYLHDHHKDKWNKPNDTTDDQCHLMVQIMESWFLADKDTLMTYYGPKFYPNALSNNPDIENIHKQDVLKGLEKATKSTKRGKYNKGSHSFDILAQIDPEKVQQASPYAKRLITTLKGNL